MVFCNLLDNTQQIFIYLGIMYPICLLYYHICVRACVCARVCVSVCVFGDMLQHFKCFTKYVYIKFP